jgi:hypothetical protein
MAKNPQINELQRLSAAAQARLGLPEGFALYSPFPFGGMNQQASRIALEDNEWFWKENFISVGPGNMRAAWDVGAVLYSVTSGNTATIIYFYFYNIGPTNYVAIFLSDGTAVQVNTSTGAQTTITSNTGLFYQASSGQRPACVSWGSKYLVISNNNTFNDYWIWDGTLLYAAGQAGPIVDITDGGANYSSLPTVTAYGGSGSGTTVSTTILNGSVETTMITSPGNNYVPGDTVQLQYSGGGSDTGAILLALLGSGGVSSVSITAGGSSYTAPTVAFSAPGAGGTAAGAAVISFNRVTHVNITNPGAGYTAAPTVTFSGGGGSGAAGYAVIQGGQVVQVVLTNEGNFYGSQPTVTFSAPTGQVTATGTVTESAGVVTAITITNPGAGYTSPPTVTISDAMGSGATAVAYLSSGGIVGVDVVNGGTNYTFPPPLTFQGGNGTGAAATAILTATTISHINVTSGGGAPGVGGYTSAPTVVFNNNGTGGTGASAVAIISDGQVIAVNLTSAGSGYTYPPFITFTGGGLPTGAPEATAQAILTGTSIASVIMGNQGQNYTQAPAVVIEPGSNNAASAILEMMPFGVSGTSLESFQQRIWLPYPKNRTTPVLTGNIFEVTAPQSLTDFATSDGGIVYTSTSPFLRATYFSIKQVGDYLYPIGDSSVDVISNVQTSGNPITTTFTYDNTDPLTGTSWRDTVQSFKRTALFGNALGIYGIYGGAVTKLSDKLDVLFQNAVFPPAARAVIPSGAVAELFERTFYLFLLTITDPFTESPRTVMAAWDEREWFIVSQSITPTFIGTQVVNSVPTAWATDGTNLFPLLSKPSKTLTKTLATKLYGANNFPAVKLAMSLHMMATDLSSNEAGVNFGVGSLDTENGPYPLPQQLNFGSTFAGGEWTPVISGYTGDIYGCYLGLTISSTSPDFALNHLAMGYRVVWAGYGSFEPGPAPG